MRPVITGEGADLRDGTPDDVKVLLTYKSVMKVPSGQRLGGLEIMVARLPLLMTGCTLGCHGSQVHELVS